MSHFFDVYGPFDIGRDEGRVRRPQVDFWAAVQDDDEGLESAIGCYMFCLAHGETIKPWYIGKTLAAGGFCSEVFTPHKLLVYNECLDYRRGRPQLFLFPMMTGDASDAGRFSRNRSQGRTIIDWLEKTLMGMALQRNDELWNLRDTTLPRSVTVRGIMGEARQGRPYAQVVEARKALFG
jgi:hypothetical protein